MIGLDLIAVSADVFVALWIAQSALIIAFFRTKSLRQLGVPFLLGNY